MLFHHLFYSPWSQQYYNDISFHGIGVFNQLGIFCKLCVAVFVFASGYGLAVSTPVGIRLKDFYWHRFKKLYLNYWFIWLLFVPLSIFVFGRTFSEAYGDNAIFKGILDFFGLLKMFGYESFNPTWWFYNCIIVLYLFFPLLNKYILKSTYLIIVIALTIVLAYFIPGINVINSYVFTFVIGMLMAKMPTEWLNKTKWWQIVIGIALLSGWRFTKYCPIHIIDALICAGLACFLYVVPFKKWIGNIFENLGKHSMNMFLIHTFFFYFWFSDFVYITRNPILIFLTLLLFSYVASVIIEWIKKKIGFYNI